jgi:hypothetical protein
MQLATLMAPAPCNHLTRQALSVASRNKDVPLAGAMVSLARRDDG